MELTKLSQDSKVWEVLKTPAELLLLVVPLQNRLEIFMEVEVEEGSSEPSCLFR